MKALLSGWFSFDQMGATAGDLMVRDVVARWLEAGGVDYDIAVAPPFGGGVDWRHVDSAAYSHVVFVCGPFGNGEPIVSFLKKFSGQRLIGLNLSMLQRLDEWNPFDLLIERDSSDAAHADLAFAAQQVLVPVVGSVLVHPQREYKRGMHREVHAVIAEFIASRELAVVPIDTRLDVNATGLRTAAEVESLIARMDVVITTRLHGTVLALKNGVPPIVIDPIAGGAKIVRQTEAIGWNVIFTPEEVSVERLQRAFDYCLSPTGRAAAEACRTRATVATESVRRRFMEELATSRQLS